MPDEILDWSEENLTAVLSELYREAVSNAAFRAELMADPSSVLSRRIDIPEEYRGKIIAQDQTAKILVLNVPVSVAERETVEGTVSVSNVPDFLICTTYTEW